MEENIMKISFHILGQFWQQEEDQLTSASVPYQMVGLFDYKNVLISNLHYIWVSFLAKLLLSNRNGTPCSFLLAKKLKKFKKHIVADANASQKIQNFNKL